MAGYANSPNLPSLSTDPSQVNTPGLQSEITNVYNQGGQAQGQANNGAMAGLARAGVGADSSESGNALGNIAGQTAGAESSALSGLQQQQFNEQNQLMQSLNQENLQNYYQQGMVNPQVQDVNNAATSSNVSTITEGAKTLGELFAMA